MVEGQRYFFDMAGVYLPQIHAQPRADGDTVRHVGGHKAQRDGFARLNLNAVRLKPPAWGSRSVNYPYAVWAGRIQN
jgi:hypothetical protein